MLNPGAVAARTEPCIRYNVLAFETLEKAKELAPSGDAGVGALCRYAHASGLITHPVR